MESTKKCPDCGAKLKPIEYGLIPESVVRTGKVIAGGCLVDGTEPHFGCSDCGYQGFPGGREYKTKHTKPKYKPGTENSKNPEIIHVVFDVVEASEEELWGWAEGLFEARLELIHRGVAKEAIEQYGLDAENWDAMPFDPTELVILQYNPVAEKIISAGIFYAEGKAQTFIYRLPDMETWATCYSRGDFEYVNSHYPKSDSIQTWELVLDEDASEDAYFGSDSSLGNPMIEAMLKGRNVTKTELSKYANEFERFFIWPSWFFEPSLAFSPGPRSGLK